MSWPSTSVEVSFFFEIIKGNYEMAANIIVYINLIESVQKCRKISPDYVDTLISQIGEKFDWISRYFAF